MGKEKYVEFIFGQTPTYFMAGIDMFIQCATWFDSEECWDEQLLNDNTLFANVGLSDQYRTEPLKLYTFLNATNPHRSLWRNTNIAFVLFHLYTQAESRVYVVDGYPKEVWNIVEAKLTSFIEKAWFGDPRAYAALNRIQYIYTRDEREYLRERGNIEVIAEEHERWYQPHLSLEESDIPGFNEYNKCLYSKMETQYGSNPAPAYAGGLSADPITMEEIDEMYTDDDEDDNEGGGLQ